MGDEKPRLSKIALALKDTEIRFRYEQEDGIVEVSMDPSRGFTTFTKYPFSKTGDQEYVM